jgi:cytochrome c oxidase subunit 1
MGSHGMPRRYFNYPPQFQTAHQISTVGAFILAFGILVHFIVLLWSIKYGEKAPANPWGAKTLEWTVESPPTMHNFHETPVVTAFPYEYKSERV